VNPETGFFAGNPWLHENPVSEPPPSGFTRALVRANGLDARGFESWRVDPAMRFGAAHTWWSDRGPRPRPHEGLDLCSWRDRAHVTYRLDTETLVPAMYDGTVVRLCDDYIGRSVMMAHRFPGLPGAYYTLYGHTRPCASLEVDRLVRAGEIVARLAPVTRPGSTVLPHLHISLGWSPDPIPPERLDWNILPDVLYLLDPLPVL